MDLSLSLFPNKLFPPVLPPKMFVGGGPAGVVVGLNEKPDGAGVVEPVGADEVAPPVETLPKSPCDCPGAEPGPVPKKGLGGVCEPPIPPKDGVLEPAPKPSNPLATLLFAVAPFDGLFSPALEALKLAKLKPLFADLLVSAFPKRLLPVT